MTLDTNIIIAYLKDEPPVASFLDEAKKQRPLFLPAAVEGEFLYFCFMDPGATRRYGEIS